MRSFRLSTKLQRVQLSVITNYGREACGNRRKDLFLIALFLLVLPDLLDLLTWQQASAKTVLAFKGMGDLAPMAQMEALASFVSSQVTMPIIVLNIVKILGILMLARTSVDYFESRPSPLKTVATRSLRTLLTKGLGTLVFLIIAVPATSIVPFLFVITMSLLVMLPVTLISSSHGGFKTSKDTLFLNYAAGMPGGKMPVFMNILPVTGFFITAMIGVTFLLDQIPVLDVILEIPAGFFSHEVHLFGSAMNLARLCADILIIFWQALCVSVAMPFTAAIYHLTTAPEGHEDFATTA
jgi:hypothetical protein